MVTFPRNEIKRWVGYFATLAKISKSGGLFINNDKSVVDTVVSIFEETGFNVASIKLDPYFSVYEMMDYLDQHQKDIVVLQLDAESIHLLKDPAIQAMVISAINRTYIKYYSSRESREFVFTGQMIILSEILAPIEVNNRCLTVQFV